MPPTSEVPSARIPQYDLSVPTEADALGALQRVFGPARGLDTWTAACRASGQAVGTLASIEDLERATQALAQQEGAAATVARSIMLRVRTYTWLAQRAAAKQGR